MRKLTNKRESVHLTMATWFQNNPAIAPVVSNTKVVSPAAATGPTTTTTTGANHHRLHHHHHHSLAVRIKDQCWNVHHGSGDLACLINFGLDRGGLGKLYNADGALVAKVERRRLLLNPSHTISLVIGRGAETINKVSVQPHHHTSGGALSSFLIKIRLRNHPAGLVTRYRWLCVSPTEWRLTKGLKLDNSSASPQEEPLLGHFHILSRDAAQLSFYHIDCPAHASVFTLAIAFITNSHINLLDALSMTSRSTNII